MTLPEPTPLTEVRKLVRACLYGPLGSAKSSTVAKVCRVLGGRSLWLTADSAWQIITSKEFADLEIDQIPFKPYGKGTIKGTQLPDSTWGIVQDIIEKWGDGAYYRNFVLDPFSTMSDIGRLFWTRKVQLNEQRNELLSGYGHYNIVKDTFQLLVPHLRNSNLNIFYICHDAIPSEEQVKKTRRSAATPNLPYQTYNLVGQECNLLGYCHKNREGQRYLIQTEGTVNISGKSQIPTVPQSNFDVDKLPGMISEWVNG